LREVERAEFEDLVRAALEELPTEIRSHLENVAVFIGEWPDQSEVLRAGLEPGRQMLGLYEGVPLTKRGLHYTLVTPDRITLYRGPLLSISGSLAELREQVARTVVHEVAHHFGISEHRIRELGY